jgi:tetratricopeptide (TPR) repeat protein
MPKPTTTAPSPGEPRANFDRAIANYGEAIRLDPKFALAYAGRGATWQDKRDLDRAIANYDEAIRLNPKFALAYAARGAAWRAKGDPDRAIADDSEAIRLDPKNATAYNDRGRAYSAKGVLDRAIADYTETIRLNPKDSSVYFNRGRANIFSGALSDARSDLNQASDMDPKYAYSALWLDIVNKRSNLPSRLAEETKQIDMTKWPAPVIRLYLGQSTPAAVLAAADDPNVETKKGQVCEANFYIGELALQQSNNDEAKRLFGRAAADCPKEFIEYEAAAAELRALGASP